MEIVQVSEDVEEALIQEEPSDVVPITMYFMDLESLDSPDGVIEVLGICMVDVDEGHRISVLKDDHKVFNLVIVAISVEVVRTMVQKIGEVPVIVP